MKKKLSILWLFFYGLLPFVTLAQGNNIAIEGKITLGKEWKSVVYLSKVDSFDEILSGSSSLVIDSARIDARGNFQFTNVRLSLQPKLYRLVFGLQKDVWTGMANGVKEHNIFYLVLSKKDNIKITANSNFFAKSYEQKSNLKVNQELQYLLNELSPFLEKGSGIEAILDANRENPKLDSILAKQINEFKNLHRATIFERFKKLAAATKHAELAAVALSYMELEEYVRSEPTEIKSLLEKLTRKFPTSVFFVQAQNNISKKEKKADVSKDDKLTIQLKDTAGVLIDASSLHFKIAIVDFWASWCGPCKMEARTTLQPLYKKYKQSGLEVIGISTDEDAQKWKKAVNSAQSGWTQLIDSEKKYSKLLQIKSLPTLYVINADGKIIAKNLRGVDLTNFVTDYFSTQKN